MSQLILVHTNSEVNYLIASFGSNYKFDASLQDAKNFHSKKLGSNQLDILQLAL